MKLALCTTTIHVPHALKLLRTCNKYVGFFVACDDKTPNETISFVADLRCGDEHFNKLNGAWKCAEIIGWNTLARRNIAFLDALQWGADVIYSWDDDNLPMAAQHFADILAIFESLPYTSTSMAVKFHGLKVSSNTGWFDPGALLIPPAKHRGFPHGKHGRNVETVIDAKAGVAAGLVIGDPDVDATTRLEHRPDVGGVHLFGETGIVVDPNTWTVFNSQNTAVVRELIPAWFMMPGVGRFDDIYASLIVQRVARERDYYVHFGRPFTFHERNRHDIYADLAAEIEGMREIEHFASILNNIILPARSVIEDTRIIYDALSAAALIPARAHFAVKAWLEDCEGVL